MNSEVTNDKVIIRDNQYETVLDTLFSNLTETVLRTVLVFFRLAIIFSHSEAPMGNKQKVFITP